MKQEMCPHCKGQGYQWFGDNNTGSNEYCTSCDRTGKILFIEVNAYLLRDILEEALEDTGELVNEYRKSHTLKKILKDIKSHIKKVNEE